MIEKKNNKTLLNEELKKHMRLSEYTFYVGEDDDVVGNSDKDLLLGEDPEEDDIDIPNGDEPMDEPAADLGPDGGGDMEEPPMEEPPMEDPAVGDTSMEEPPMEEPPMDIPPVEDEVELDVTQLVQGTEEAKMSADMANQKMGQLINQFNELNDKLNSLEDLNGKIAELEDEIVKRNPTQIEKLEMRSLDSFPYNLKLTDYWEDKESDGDIQATGDAMEPESEPEEYVLTQDDVDSEYNQQQVPKSFNIDDEEDELDKFEYLK